MTDDRKICVVSLIGKSQYLPNQTKAWKLNALLEKNVFQSDFSMSNNFLNKNTSKNDPVEENENTKSKNTEENTPDDYTIEHFLDYKNQVMFVHLESIYDTNNLLLAVSKQIDSQKNFFDLWENEQTKFIKAVILVFSISHIIILSSPSCEFDISYIRFFRIIDILRNKMLPSIVELLKSLDLPISKDWIYAARPCSPRVLFTFENCSRDILNLTDSEKTLEKLQHSLEDQIYNSLRKSYVITNISNNSLFAIPANQEFVYIHRLINQFSYIPNNVLLSNNYCSSSNHETDAISFRKFVFQHIKTALTDGFNDNIGRTNVLPVFELPNINSWSKIYDALKEFFLKDPKSQKMQSYYTQLKSHVDIELQFSENRCKKVLPSALNLYQENLPNHYSKKQHQQKLDQAINLFHLNARGPIYNHYLNKLKNKCLDIWTNGRQLCEAISLTGHNCINELHQMPKNGLSTNKEDEIDSKEFSLNSSLTTDELENLKETNSDKNDDDKELLSLKNLDLNKNKSDNEEILSRNTSVKSSNKLPAKSHNSNVITRAASNCGEFQRERKDPFDLIEANFSFYDEFSSMEMITKKIVMKYEFKNLKPNTSTAKIPSQISDNKTSDPEMLSQIGKNLTSESSCIESYSDKMIHSESSLNFQPKFSSWSLVSIGKFDDYNVHNGLSQPGFLPNYNHLLPWDIFITNNEVTSFITKSSSRKNQGKSNRSKGYSETDLITKKSKTISIKAYIGMEYECPLGHRFICSGPDRVVRLSNNGTVKDDGYKLINCDMPLYTACPCRNAKDSTPYMAQMMRVFIVTPPENINQNETGNKLNQNEDKIVRLNIGIRPRVQPNPHPCPIFWPSNDETIVLAENSIWVLRLPYIYMGDDGKPYYRPKDFDTLNNCRVLKGVFTLITNNQ